MNLLLRLAVGSGRAAVARLLLVALGTALATPLLLLAVGVAGIARDALAISSNCTVDEFTGAQDCSPGSSGPVTNNYLVEPALRHGVVIGFVLCVVPLAVFVATAARVAARRRDERLAGLRLAGATDIQVRALAALDTAAGATAGALAGTVGYLLVRAAVVRRSGSDLAAVAQATTPGPVAGLLVIVLLVAGLAAGAVLALRSVRITPLGVARRAPRRVPRPWGLVLLLVGATGFPLMVGSDTAVGLGALLAGAFLAAAALGLVTCGPWATSLTGRLLASRAPGPVRLLAGRRLEDDPRAQARATTPVVLVVLAATIGLVAYRATLQNADSYSRAFYDQGFALAAAAMAFSLVVGASGLLLTTLEGLLERRRTLAALHAQGVPLAVLRRAVLLQAGLPVLPLSLLAVLAGLAVYGSIGRELPPATVLLLPPLAVLAAVGAAALSLPALRSTTDPELLRSP